MSKAIKKESQIKKTAGWDRPGGGWDKFLAERENARQELKAYLLYGGPLPRWLRSFDMLPAKNKKTNCPTFGWAANYGCNKARCLECACWVLCYAKTGNYTYTNVIQSRARRAALYELAPALFWDIFQKNLAKKYRQGFRTVRLLDAGDLPDVEFLRGLAAVAKEWPDVNFYGYSKKYELLEKAGALPSNLVFMRSRFLVPGKEKSASFLTVDTLAGQVPPRNFKACPGSDCNKCGLCAAGALVWAPLHD